MTWCTHDDVSWKKAEMRIRILRILAYDVIYTLYNMGHIVLWSKEKLSDLIDTNQQNAAYTY